MEELRQQEPKKRNLKDSEVKRKKNEGENETNSVDLWVRQLGSYGRQNVQKRKSQSTVNKKCQVHQK